MARPPALAEALTLEQRLDHDELEEKLHVFAELLANLNCPSDAFMNKDVTPITLAQIYQNIDLSEEDVLILRMAYQEGLKLNKIAEALGMPSYQPGRILKRIFVQLIEAMKLANISTEHLRALLAEVEL